MLFHGIELVCPACRSDLSASDSSDEAALQCVACSKFYPVILGIPDLRLWPDPYIDFEADRDKARMLAAECADLGFAESIELYYRVTTAVPSFQARRFARSLLAARDRSAALVRELERTAGTRPAGDLLELGCGTAPLLVTAAPTGERAIGVDIALRWLAMAQKRLAEAGVQAPLVCACAEALPFADAAFGRIVAESTLEHLRDQAASLRECHRVLRPGGQLLISTPNRHSIGPDPHTGLPAGGWLPDSITASYVRRKGGVPPRRRLLTPRALRASLEAAGFRDVVIEPPRVPAAQRASFGAVARLAIDAYNTVRRLPGGTLMLRTVGPLLHAVAHRPASGRAVAS